MKARLVVLVVVVVAVAGVPASAHSVEDYPAFGWKYTIPGRVFYQAPNHWPNAYNAPTWDAMDTWTYLSGSSLSFTLAGDAVSDSWSCGTAWDLVRTADLLWGQLAGTTVCSTANSTTRIRVNTDYTWYTGSSTPNPSNQFDLQATMTHELGHAHQAWMLCTDGGNDDPCRGKHYDSTYNGAICDVGELQDYHTMCAESLTGDKKWRLRSLEIHDKDLVNDMY